jgi:hypothetical protein
VYQASSFFKAIVHEKSTSTIGLDDMVPSDIDRILCAVIRTRFNQSVKIPDRLINRVQQDSLGNCFWIKEICKRICNDGIESYLSHMDNDGKFNPLQNIIISRLDSLSSEGKMIELSNFYFLTDFQGLMIVKYASVLGSISFTIQEVATILPIDNVSTVLEQLNKFIELGVMQCVTQRPCPVYSFRNHIIRHAIYSMMPPRLKF